MLLQKHKPLVNILPKKQEEKIKNLAVKHHKEDKAGIVQGVQQMGANLMLAIEWEDQSVTSEWLTCVFSLEPKKFNIPQFLEKNGIVNEYKKLIIED